ncbi:DsbA family protein [Pseudomonadota bacterium]
MPSTLYYIHDPMCSWCWGHRVLWDKLQKLLPDNVVIEYVAGGLAADTNTLMPIELQQTIQGYWREIQAKFGIAFNFDFWKKNSPRRSTYIACRAVIAAKSQGFESEMIDAIQQAYYLRALNPSDSAILVRLAEELSSRGLDLDVDQFGREMESPATHQMLQQQISLARELTHQGFPSIVLEHNGVRHSIVREYQDCNLVLAEIQRVLSI